MMKGPDIQNLLKTKLICNNYNLLTGMVYEGEILNLTHITRSDMGPYLCIANNSIPPIVSKRINVEVHCKYLFLLINVGLQGRVG